MSSLIFIMDLFPAVLFEPERPATENTEAESKKQEAGSRKLETAATREEKAGEPEKPRLCAISNITTAEKLREEHFTGEPIKQIA